MKKFFNIPLAIVMLVGVLVVSAHAQGNSGQRLIASIPFTFTAGKTTLPAGKYTITVLNPTSDRKVLQLRSMNGRASTIVMTTTGTAHASDEAKVVFERYGDRYFFAEAQMVGGETSLAAVRHRDRGEKNVMAKGNKKSVVVIVAE
jgi:hypothetical protein